MSAQDNLSLKQFGPVKVAHESRLHRAEASVSSARHHLASHIGNGMMKALDALEGPHDADQWNDHPPDIGELF